MSFACFGTYSFLGFVLGLSLCVVGLSKCLGQFDRVLGMRTRIGGGGGQFGFFKDRGILPLQEFGFPCKKWVFVIGGCFGNVVGVYVSFGGFACQLCFGKKYLWERKGGETNDNTSQGPRPRGSADRMVMRGHEGEPQE